MIYADTSLLVSIYVADDHSADADSMVSSHSGVCFSPLHLAEWTHAIAQQVFRRQLSVVEAERIHGELDRDRTAGLWANVAIPEHAFDLCADLARRYGPKFGVRTLDSLHVACALEFKAERFWTFDERQAKLAKAAGLKIA